MLFMKTRFLPVLVLGTTISSLAFCTGCKEEREQVPVVTTVPAVVGSVEPATAQFTPEEPIAATPVAVPNVIPEPAVSVAPASPTNMPPDEDVVAQLVQPAVPADSVTNSPALDQVVRMVQSGVSEEIILSYVKNAPEPFGVGPDQIIYLNDLGTSTAIVKGLIEHDGAADMQGRKAGTAAPLPPGVALNTPASNVYVPQANGQAPNPALPAAYEQSAPVTDSAPAVASNVQPPAQAPASVNYFYAPLTPYGNWVDVPGYGLCWQPTVAVVNSTWRPYADNGRWMWTDYGWYWYSDYSWGWAPFHYGRWCSRPRVGWFWVPDTHWGPSWVSWRYTSDYYGWAPLPPGVAYVSGVGLNYHGSGFSVGFDFGLTDFYYTYIPTRYFCNRYPGRYYVSRHDVHGIHSHSIVRNHYEYRRDNHFVNHGPGFQRVSTATHGQVPRASVTARPFDYRPSGRVEQIQTRGNQTFIARPELPKSPPTPTRVSAPAPRTVAGTSGSAANFNSTPSRTAVAPTAAPRSMKSTDRPFDNPAPAAAQASSPRPAKSEPATRTAPAPARNVDPAATPRAPKSEPKAPSQNRFSTLQNQPLANAGSTPPAALAPSRSVQGNAGSAERANPFDSGGRPPVATPRASSTPAATRSAPPAQSAPAFSGLEAGRPSAAPNGNRPATYATPLPPVRTAPAARTTPPVSAPARPTYTPAAAPRPSAPPASAPARPTYSAPRQSYSAPAAPPRQSYSAPAPAPSRPSYSASARPFDSAPRQSYSPPARSSGGSPGASSGGGRSNGGGRDGRDR